MKPFNLEEAKKGCPVCTRDGRKARIICWDAKVQFGLYPIVALVESDRSNEPFCYTLEGLHCQDSKESDLDLMMTGEKKEGWVNIYRGRSDNRGCGCIYQTKEEAIKASNYEVSPNYVTTAKIEWEE